MVADAELLRRYTEDGSEESFAELVNRHLRLVYVGALRRTSGDCHLAADISQKVFVQLACHAHSLRRHTELAAWLFAATRNAAINACVAEQRPDFIDLRWWQESASGKGFEGMVRLTRRGEEWLQGRRHPMSDQNWQKFISRIDPATGAVVPEKK